MPFKNSEEDLNKWHQEMVELVKSRGHQLESGKMTIGQREKCYIVYCPTHDISIEISFYNYKRSKIGCPLCANNLVSNKLKGRIYTEETLIKMKKAA